MFSNSSYPVNLYNKSVTKNRLGANWKFIEGKDTFIANEYITSNRPPSFNNVTNQGKNNLTISGSNANNFRTRPLKLWRKQSLPNFELYNQKNRKLKNTLLETEVAGGTSISKQQCNNENTNCESTKIIPNWKTFVRSKDDFNKIGQFDIINQSCHVNCDNKFIKKVIVCDPEINAKKQVLYPSSVNSLNTPIYYQDYESYLHSRCKTYPDSFIKTNKNVNNKKIKVLKCKNNQPNGSPNEIPYLKCFINNQCSKQIYKTSNPQFSKNSAVNSGSVTFRKKLVTLRENNILNNGIGLSNFNNSVSSSMTGGVKNETPFLFKTTPLTEIHTSSGGAKIDPIKYDYGLFRKQGNFTTSCLNGKNGKLIGHMQLNFNNRDGGFFGTQRQQNNRKKR